MKPKSKPMKCEKCGLNLDGVPEDNLSWRHFSGNILKVQTERNHINKEVFPLKYYPQECSRCKRGCGYVKDGLCEICRYIRDSDTRKSVHLCDYCADVMVVKFG